MTKTLAKQMDFLFQISEEQATGFFEGNLQYGDGQYGALVGESLEDYSYYYLCEDGFSNQYWEWIGDRIGQDGPLLNQWLARQHMSQTA